MNFKSLMQECNSPVDKDFIWLAEYNDGTVFHEFDLETKQQRHISDVQQDKVERFGLIGHGLKLYYEKASGIFKLAGQMIEVSLKTTNYEFFLTGNMKNSEIIYDYDSYIKIADDGNKVEVITEYRFGYTTILNINGFVVNYKVACHVPYGKPIFLKFEATTNMDTDGVVRIRKNREIVEQSYRILKAGELNSHVWELK